MAVTLASNSIFEAFLSDTKADALLHGHSYTAHPVGCEVANESLTLLEKLSKSGSWTEMQRSWKETSTEAASSSAMWSMWTPEFLAQVSLPETVDSAMTMGTVLAIKIRGANEGMSFSLVSGITEIPISLQDMFLSWRKTA